MTTSPTRCIIYRQTPSSFLLLPLPSSPSFSPSSSPSPLLKVYILCFYMKLGLFYDPVSPISLWYLMIHFSICFLSFLLDQFYLLRNVLWFHVSINKLSQLCIFFWIQSYFFIWKIPWARYLWHLCTILVFRRLRQQDCHEFKASFGYIVSSRLQNEILSQEEEGGEGGGGGEEEEEKKEGGREERKDHREFQLFVFIISWSLSLGPPLHSNLHFSLNEMKIFKAGRSFLVTLIWPINSISCLRVLPSSNSSSAWRPRCQPLQHACALSVHVVLLFKFCKVDVIVFSFMPILP